VTARKTYYRAESAQPTGPKKKAVEVIAPKAVRPGTRTVEKPTVANVCGAQRMMAITLPKEPWA
jgi:hypothetical protein